MIAGRRTSLRKQGVQGVRWTSISTVIRTAVQMAQLVILSRILRPEDFGLMAMVTAAVGLGLAFGDMGISNAVIHYQDATPRELASLYWLNLFVGLGLFLGLWWATPFIVLFLRDIRLTPIMHWMALLFLVMPFGQQCESLLQRALDFRTLALVETAAVLTGAVVAVVTALFGAGVYALVWGALVNGTLKSVGLGIYGWLRWPPRSGFHARDIQRFLSFSLFQTGERMINYFSQHLDKLLLGRFLGAQAVGYYAVAYNLMMRPLLLVNPVLTRVAFPVFSRVQNDNRRLRQAYLELVQGLALLLFPVYLGMAVLAAPIMGLLLGPQWIPSVPIFRVLCLLGLFYSIGNPMGSLLLGKGRADIGFYFNIAVTLLYALGIMAAASHGMLAVALTLVVITAVGLFPAGIWVRWKLVGLPPWDYLAALAPMLACSLIMAGVTLEVTHIHILPWKGRLLAPVGAGLIGALVYLGLIRIFLYPLVRHFVDMVRSD